MKTAHYIAVDLGAESGRVMLGTLSGENLTLEEIHRFSNPVLKISGHLHWDLPHLQKEIFAGLEKAGSLSKSVAGISTDSWGVDYVLLDAKDQPIATPHCYRDERTKDSPARLFTKLPFSAVYQETGIQFMAINTLFQLEAEQHDHAAVLAQAASFLNIADYFNAQFCGVKVAEQSMASTTQIYNPETQNWSQKLITALGLPAAFFPKIVPSATILGPVTTELKKNSALTQTQVIATCSHDTGSAVAAVPAVGGKPWAYLSSGTWSLLGAELSRPIMSEAAREAGFTNEVGLGSTIRFLKNIAGLWVVQECRRAWTAEGKDFSYDDLTRMAMESGPAQAHISLQDPRFLTSGDMPEKITAFCRENGQPGPKNPGEYVRTILESLARTYAQTLRQLESLLGHKIETLHVVGGGSRNDLLNQLTADAVGIPVVVGPVEATAIGNILIQALALGQLESLNHLRRVVAAAFPTRAFHPGTAINS